MAHFHCYGREITKTITVFSYPPVVHRDYSFLHAPRLMLFPLSISFPLQSILLLLPVTIPSCSSHAITKLWWSAGAHVGLSHTEIQGTATHIFLLPTVWGISTQKAVSRSEEWGEVRSPQWAAPIPPSHSWETNGTSASYVFTCALWSLFSSSCLINCFVSFSSFLLLPTVLFAYKRWWWGEAIKA